METINKTAHSMNRYDYPLIRGDNYYCVPTCIEMIVSLMGYSIVTEKLMTHFHVVTGVLFHIGKFTASRR